MMSDEEIPLEVLNDKNRHSVRCNYCNSLILRPQQANFIETEFDIPTMRQHNRQDNLLDTESLRHFWRVNDMFIFENIGFSHNVNRIKYLVCADCEMGPVGLQDLDKNECYIALKRVRHGCADTGITSEINTAAELNGNEDGGGDGDGDGDGDGNGDGDGDKNE